MTIEETLVNTLSELGVKVFPLVKPIKESFPCIVYQRISTSIKRTLTGTVDLNRVRMQVACFGNTYQEAKDLANQVRNLLEANTEIFEVSTLENQVENQEENINQIILEFFIWSKLI